MARARVALAAPMRDLGYVIPLVARRHERSRLHALGDLVNHLVGQLTAALEPELNSELEASPGGDGGKGTQW